MIRRIGSELRYRWRWLTRRADVEAELEMELANHLEYEAEQLRNKGMSDDEARRAARVAFGGFEATREASRDTRGLLFAEQLWADIRYAARSLRLRPVFSAGVILALSLGIGLNATMFGVADRLMFRAPAGLIEPDHLHRVYLHWTQYGEPRVDRTMQFPRYVDLSRATSSVEHTVAYAVRLMAVGFGMEVREVPVAAASASLFQQFDVQPAIGRWFNASDDEVPNGNAVAVLSYDYWQSAYGGQVSVIGSRLRIGQMSVTVIGVAPKRFAGFSVEAPPPVAYVPISAYAFSQRGAGYESSYSWGWLELFVRRKSDVSVQQATAELTAAFVSSWRAEEAEGGTAQPLDVWKPFIELGPVQLSRGPEAGIASRLALALSGVALLVLLLAMANIANLLLLRAVSRRREIAMRLALGIGRARLARQLLIESLLLGLGGAAAGLLIAAAAGGILRSLLLSDATHIAVLTDARTVWYAVGIALIAGIGAGVLPVIHSGRERVADALRSGGRGSERRLRARSILIVSQAALSMMLLFGAGIFVRSFQKAQARRLGYDAERLLYAEANMRGTQLTHQEEQQLSLRMLSVAEALRGAEAATLAITVPFWRQEGRGFTVPGVDSVRKLGRFVIQAGTADYFRTTGTRILRGRAFEAGDAAGGDPVVVVDEGMARAVWPDREALGQCIRMDDERVCRRVVGIAESVQLGGFDSPRRFMYYVPILQYPQAMAALLYVRVRPDAAVEVAEELRTALQQAMPGEAFVRVIPLTTLVAPAIQPWRFGATVFVVFGVLAAILAAVGLYSVISYDVSQRERELGVRKALGASAPSLFSSVVLRGARLAGAGILIGGVIGVAGARWGRSLLFDQSPDDPFLIGTVALGLAAVAAIACMVPALRAGRVDPSVALRGD